MAKPDFGVVPELVCIRYACHALLDSVCKLLKLISPRDNVSGVVIRRHGIQLGSAIAHVELWDVLQSHADDRRLLAGTLASRDTGIGDQREAGVFTLRVLDEPLDLLECLGHRRISGVHHVLKVDLNPRVVLGGVDGLPRLNLPRDEHRILRIVPRDLQHFAEEGLDVVAVARHQLDIKGRFTVRAVAPFGGGDLGGNQLRVLSGNTLERRRTARHVIGAWFEIDTLRGFRHGR